MKTFLQIVESEEKNDKHVVMAFGRMNPPTTGHMKLVDKVHDVADKHKAKHVVVVSHSQDSKKNPLSAEQKVKHLKRYSPKTNFDAASKEHPTIMHHAAKLHKAGFTHLHVIAGSDRVKEYQDTLNKYNGKADKKGHVPYHFKKITVHSAGHRDPDSEGTEGMSASKMREHASKKNFGEFRKGVPSHVSDTHAKELMHDVRKGMGLHESATHGQFKAIFVTGGPGSGKDIIIREAIAEGNAVELNTKQAFDILNDKHRLSQKSNDFRFESIRNRGPLIINGPAEDSKINMVREELEELGYDTLIVFVDTTNEASQERNGKLSKMISESVRQERWKSAQDCKKWLSTKFENFLLFDNSASLSEIEESITDTYQIINMFLEHNSYSETATTWLLEHGRISINDSFNMIFEETNAKKDSKSIQKQTVVKYNPSFTAKSPADVTPDNRAGGNPPGQTDQVKGDTFPRKDPNGKGHSGGAWSGAYSTEETSPKISRRPDPKESNFSQDKDKTNRKKFGDSSISAQRTARPSGVGQEYDTRAGGQGAAAGAGLGQNLYGETQEFSNASQNGTAMLGAKLEPNPLDSSYNNKPFKKFRKQLKEYNGFQNDVESGVGGVLGGADNKEGMDTYKDANRNIGITINKKKKKQEK